MANDWRKVLISVNLNFTIFNNIRNKRFLIKYYSYIFKQIGSILCPSAYLQCTRTYTSNMYIVHYYSYTECRWIRHFFWIGEKKEKKSAGNTITTKCIWHSNRIQLLYWNIHFRLPNNEQRTTNIAKWLRCFRLHSDQQQIKLRHEHNR